MKVKHHRPAALFVLVATAIVALAIEPVPPVEPLYKGKSLSAWLTDREKSLPGLHRKGDQQKVLLAEEAVREIGTNGLPWLLHELSAREKTRGDDLPTNFTSGEAINRRWRAMEAFSILGSSARSATPRLVELLDDKQTSYTAATALGGIGLESIPVLTKALNSPRDCARESAARVLGMFGTNAHMAIPAMIQCAKEKSGSVRGFATFSLGQINMESETVVPVLVSNLEDPSTRINAVYALRNFGNRAKSAVPALLKAMKENDAKFKELAQEAVREINMENDL
jgi:HEAT repeat protein